MYLPFYSQQCVVGVLFKELDLKWPEKSAPWLPASSPRALVFCSGLLRVPKPILAHCPLAWHLLRYPLFLGGRMCTVVSNLSMCRSPVGAMLKQMARSCPPPTPDISDSVGLGWDKRVCISHKLQGAAVAGSGTLQRTTALGYGKEQKPLVGRAGFPSNDATELCDLEKLFSFSQVSIYLYNGDNSYFKMC